MESSCVFAILLITFIPDISMADTKYPNCWQFQSGCEIMIYGRMIFLLKRQGCQIWCEGQGYGVGECRLTGVDPRPPQSACWECHCYGKTMLPMPKYIFS